jgi:hypothetical protein
MKLETALSQRVLKFPGCNLEGSNVTGPADNFGVHDAGAVVD